MPRVRTCAWWTGYGVNHRSCHQKATHEWTITGMMSGWSPACDDHRMISSVPGEMISGARRLVRELDTIDSNPNRAKVHGSSTPRSNP